MSSLSDAPATPAMALSVASLFDEAEWVELRDRALAPLHVSELVTRPEDRAEFLRGAEMLRFHGRNAMRGRSPQPQQLLVVDALAAGCARNGALLPRRSSKSTTLIAIGLGRAEARDDYRVAVFTLTSGKAGRSRFLKDVVPALERSGMPLGSYKIVKSAGQERVEFPVSGGSVSWLSSIDDLRGEAFDLIILDEAGEPDRQKVEDTLAAALPTLDTRPDAQIVVAGTAGKYRGGNLLWDWLAQGRAAIVEALEKGTRSRVGIVEYAIPDTLQDEDLETWEQMEPLILAAHPGIGTLTTLEQVRGNFEALPRSVFLAEYGGLFGNEGGTTTLFDPLKWARTGTDDARPEQPPGRFALAFAAHPDQLCVSIVAAWRDEEGRAFGMVLKRVDGIDGAAPWLLRAARKHRVPIVFDSGQQVNALIVEKLNREKSRPRLEPRTYIDVKRAASLIVDEVDRENVVHYRDDLVLTEGIHKTVKRASGDRGWLLGRNPKTPDDDITPVEAWALALQHYDNSRPRAKARSVVAA